MRIVRFCCVSFLVFLALCGCKSVNVRDGGGGATPGLEPLPWNARPRIAVEPVTQSSSSTFNNFSGQQQFLQNLTTRLTKELVACNRFIVLSRDRLKSILNEQKFSSSDAVDRRTRVQQGKIQGAAYLVKATILDMKLERSSGGIGVSITAPGGNSRSGTLGWATAYVEMNVEVVHTATSAVVFSANAIGEVTNTGFVTNLTFDSGRSAGGLGGFNSPAMSEAVQACLKHLVQKLAKAAGTQIPAS
ncbi:MAG: hypothetical protein D6805_10460 [Planctomycetota bacterium]|nr:MAG: hypothetical protein D6805_10460 [Planctomycetota bacterium]